MTVQEMVMYYVLALTGILITGVFLGPLIEIWVRAAVRGYYEQRFESNRKNYCEDRIKQLKQEVEDGKQAGP